MFTWLQRRFWKSKGKPSTTTANTFPNSIIRFNSENSAVKIAFFEDVMITKQAAATDRQPRGLPTTTDFNGNRIERPRSLPTAAPVAHASASNGLPMGTLERLRKKRPHLFRRPALAEVAPVAVTRRSSSQNRCQRRYKSLLECSLRTNAMPQHLISRELRTSSMHWYVARKSNDMRKTILIQEACKQAGPCFIHAMKSLAAAMRTLRKSEKAEKRQRHLETRTSKMHYN